MSVHKDTLPVFFGDADSLASHTEIIPIVSKDDESFLLHEDPLPEAVPVLPLRNNVLFPGVVIPIGVSRQSSLNLLRMAEKKSLRIVVVAQHNDAEEPTSDDHKYCPNCGSAMKGE